MKTTQRRSIFSTAVLFLCAASLSQAQWTGSGAGGSGTDFNDEANWVGGVVNGSFVNNTTTATITLTDPTTSLTDLNFYWTTAGTNLFLNGNGTGANEVISLAGNVYLPIATGGVNVTIGSDVTLDFGSFSTSRTFRYGGTGSGSGLLTINGLVTGTATGSANFTVGWLAGAGNANVTLNNTGNTFVAPLSVSGILRYASIANVGGGASALGAATTVTNGTITLNSGAQTFYNGSTNQSSDRKFQINAEGNIAIGHEGAGGKLTLTGGISSSASTHNLVFLTSSNSSNTAATIDVTGVIENTGTATTSIEKRGWGTVSLQNTANTYKGITSIGYGTLEVFKLANGGLSSSLGLSSNAASNLVIGTWGYGGILRYAGTGDSTDRLFTIAVGGATLESAGSGAVQFTNTGSLAHSGTANSARTLTLSGVNTGDNLLAAQLGNYGTGVVSLVKKDAGKWRLTGTNTYTGATTVQAGTLIVDGSITASSGVSVSASGTLAGHGKVSAITGAGRVMGGSDVAGILSATTLNFSAGLDLAFEMRLEGAPVWSDAADSGNGVLHLSASTPILSSASGGNVISLYFAAGGTYLGGIFSNENANFESLVSGASYQYYLESVGGTYSFNGRTYSLLDAGDVVRTTVQVTSADFGDGTVTNGWSQQFAVVPEPAIALQLGLGWGLLFLVRGRRQRR